MPDYNIPNVPHNVPYFNINTSTNPRYMPIPDAPGKVPVSTADQKYEMKDYAGAGEVTLAGSYDNNLADAVGQIAAGNQGLKIDANATVSANLTVPANIPLKFDNNAVLTINTGVTLTINNMVNPGNRKVFNCVGTGKVIIPRSAGEEINLAWWHGMGGGDATVAVNKALEALKAKVGGVLRIPQRDVTSGGHVLGIEYKGSRFIGAGMDLTNWDLKAGEEFILSIQDNLNGNFKFKGIAFRGDPNVTDIITPNSSAVNFYTPNRISIQNVEFEDCMFYSFDRALNYHTDDLNSEFLNIVHKRCKWYMNKTAVRINTIDSHLEFYMPNIVLPKHGTAWDVEYVGNLLIYGHTVLGANPDPDYTSTLLRTRNRFNQILIAGGQDENIKYFLVHETWMPERHAQLTLNNNLIQGFCYVRNAFGNGGALNVHSNFNQYVSHTGWMPDGVTPDRSVAGNWMDDLGCQVVVYSTGDDIENRDANETGAVANGHQVFNRFIKPELGGTSFVAHEENYNHGFFTFHRQKNKFYLSKVLAAANEKTVAANNLRIDDAAPTIITSIEPIFTVSMHNWFFRSNDASFTVPAGTRITAVTPPYQITLSNPVTLNIVDDNRQRFGYIDTPWFNAPLEVGSSSPQIFLMGQIDPDDPEHLGYPFGFLRDPITGRPIFKGYQKNGVAADRLQLGVNHAESGRVEISPDGHRWLIGIDNDGERTKTDLGAPQTGELT